MYQTAWAWGVFFIKFATNEKAAYAAKSDYKHLIIKLLRNEETSTMEIGGCNAANDVAVIQCFCPKT